MSTLSTSVTAKAVKEVPASEAVRPRPEMVGSITREEYERRVARWYPHMVRR